MKTTLALLFSLLLNLPVFAVEDLPKLIAVEESIYRSGRPTLKGLTELRDTVGLKTIINLEDSMSNVKKEAEWAKQLGLTYHAFPTSAFSRPNDEKVDQILELMRDQSQYPILIHCKHGEDRTGLMIGLRRFYDHKWTAEQAYQEMLDLGFHTILFSLDKYYKDRTGLRIYLVPEYASSKKPDLLNYKTSTEGAMLIW